jgi:hypothetical protein
LHDPQVGRGIELTLSDLQPLDNEANCRAQIAQQVTLPRDQTHRSKKKTPDPRAQSLAPALEVGLVMGEEIGESALSLRQRGRIENDLDR